MDLQLDPYKTCFMYWHLIKEVPVYTAVCVSSLATVGGFEELILCVDSSHLSLQEVQNRYFPEVTRIVSPSDLLNKDALSTYNKLTGKYEAVNKADFFRVCVLYEYGGFYCDTDILALQPFQTLPLTETYVSAEDGTYLNNGLLFSLKGQSVFGYMLEYFLARWKPDSFNLVGPPWYTELKEYFNVNWDVKRHNMIHWKNWSRMFSPPPWEVENLIQQGVYSIHLWGSMLRRAGFSLSPDFVREQPNTPFSYCVKYLADKGSLVCKELV